ncbi:MAG: hypothetical protein HZB26_08385 [Candidatus Hydrogenedentes bacterium]|nr:hypothetical protein [Candidatus Hydrogenedentota bacterium]
MSDNTILILAMRWTHILTAITAIGGTIFIRFVLIPVAESVLDDETHARLRAGLVKRWQKFVHTCIMMFLISGFYNYFVVTGPAHSGQPLYHALFGIKFLLALAVFGLAVVLTSTKDWSKGIRANAKTWLGLLVALGVVVVMVSGVMKNIPKSGVTPSSAQVTLNGNPGR